MRHGPRDRADRREGSAEMTFASRVPEYACNSGSHTLSSSELSTTRYNARAGSSSSEVSVLPSSRRAAPRSGSQFPSLIFVTRFQGRDSPWTTEMRK